MNNCVGAANYKDFMIFVICIAIGCVFTIVIDLIMLLRVIITQESSVGIPTFILTGILLLGIIFINGLILSFCLSLLKLHYKLLKHDFTTYEYLNYMREHKKR